MQLINRHIGKFILDATEQENHKSNLRITKSPVESGANIADHAVLEPKQLTIKGKMVAYEPPIYGRLDAGIDLALLNLPKIRTAHKLTQRALRLKNEIIHTKVIADEYANVIFGKDSLGVVDDYAKKAFGKDTKQILAPFLPSFISQKTDNATSGDRLKDAVSKLYEIQRSGELLEIQTGTQLYKNMVITSIDITTDSDLYFDVTLTLEEIFIVETKIASGLKFSASGGKSNVNFGKTQPTKKSSMLKDML